MESMTQAWTPTPSNGTRSPWLRWTVAVSLFAFLAWLAGAFQAHASGVGPAQVLPVAVSVVTVTLSIALAVRAAWVALLRGDRQVISPAVPFVAAFVCAFWALQVGYSSERPPMQDVDRWMSVAAPFGIGQSDALSAKRFRRAFETHGRAVRDITVRWIVRDGERVGSLAIVDLGLAGAGGEVDLLRAVWPTSAQVDGRIESRALAATTVFVATDAGGAIALWTDAPLTFVIVATDAERAVAIARAAIAAAPRSG
jgi:hypothetical protein